jgi:hypothetical protein
MRKSIEIHDNEYRKSHGRGPRPAFGRWGFLLWDNSLRRQHGEPVFVPRSMNFADAKVWIRAHVRENFAAELATGLLSVEVAP